MQASGLRRHYLASEEGPMTTALLDDDGKEPVVDLMAALIASLPPVPSRQSIDIADAPTTGEVPE